MNPIKRCAVLTSGGDAPGMNTAIRAVVKVAAQKGTRVFGVENGYDGLIDARFRELTRSFDERPERLFPPAEIDRIVRFGGTVLGSARSSRFLSVEGRRKAAKALSDFDGLIVIGGNGSLTGAHALATEHGISVVGIPASIDNDIGCTGTSIGVDTALNTIVEACDRISDTARAHRRAFIVEVMGRDCGYLAMASAIAAGADGVLFREQGRSEHEVVLAVEELICRGFSSARNKQHVLIIKSEGVQIPCTRLVKSLERRLETVLPGVEIRGTVLGHLVRGGSPTYLDRMVAGRLAYGAVESLAAGASDEM
ncbi:MAG: ATP-dependent 6-phosphofructokinase, partial [Myxococcota bacterium]